MNFLTDAFFPIFVMLVSEILLALYFLKAIPISWHPISEYINAPDASLHSHMGILTAIFNGVVLHAASHVILWRVWNRKNWRSLFIFVSSGLIIEFWCVLVFISTPPVESTGLPIILKICAIVFPVVCFLPLAPIFGLKRDFTMTKIPKVSPFLDRLDAVNDFAQILSSHILLGIGLVSIGISGLPPLDCIRLNNPFILFHSEKVQSFSNLGWGQCQAFLYLIFLVPSFLISHFYKFQEKTPSFVWDLAIIQCAIVLNFQFYYIMGPLPVYFLETPASSQINPRNGIFWLINLFPILATLLEIFSLNQFRQKLKVK